MMHRLRLDRQIARLEQQLQARYQLATAHAGALCQRLLGPRCEPTLRWTGVAVALLLAWRQRRLWLG